MVEQMIDSVGHQWLLLLMLLMVVLMLLQIIRDGLFFHIDCGRFAYGNESGHGWKGGIVVEVLMLLLAGRIFDPFIGIDAAIVRCICDVAIIAIAEAVAGSVAIAVVDVGCVAGTQRRWSPALTDNVDDTHNAGAVLCARECSAWHICRCSSSVSRL